MYLHIGISVTLFSIGLLIMFVSIYALHRMHTERLISAETKYKDDMTSIIIKLEEQKQLSTNDDVMDLNIKKRLSKLEETNLSTKDVKAISNQSLLKLEEDIQSNDLSGRLSKLEEHDKTNVSTKDVIAISQPSNKKLRDRLSKLEERDKRNLTTKDVKEASKSNKKLTGRLSKLEDDIQSNDLTGRLSKLEDDIQSNDLTGRLSTLEAKGRNRIISDDDMTDRLVNLERRKQLSEDDVTDIFKNNYNVNDMDNRLYILEENDLSNLSKADVGEIWDIASAYNKRETSKVKNRLLELERHNITDLSRDDVKAMWNQYYLNPGISTM